MKQLLLSILLCSICPFLSRASDSAGFSRLYVAYTPQLSLNKLNIDNNSIEPGIIHAKNTFGQYAAIGFERTTRYGLIIRAGVGISKRVHDISIVKNMHGYDSNAVTNFVVTYPISVTLRSIDPELMIGYRKRLKNGWAIVAEAGLQQERYEEVEWRSAYPFLTYYNNNNAPQFVVPFHYFLEMGKNPQNDYGLAYELLGDLYVFKFYIGMEHTFTQGFLKYFSAGIELRISGDVGQILYVSSSKYLYSLSNTSVYSDRNVSLGLRVSAGFWR